MFKRILSYIHALILIYLIHQSSIISFAEVYSEKKSQYSSTEVLTDNLMNMVKRSRTGDMTDLINHYVSKIDSETMSTTNINDMIESCTFGNFQCKLQ